MMGPHHDFRNSKKTRIKREVMGEQGWLRFSLLGLTMLFKSRNSDERILPALSSINFYQPAFLV